MFRSGGIGGDERQIDIGALLAGKLLLGLFGRFPQPLEGHRILAEVDPLLLLETFGDQIDEFFVEVVTAEVESRWC